MRYGTHSFYRRGQGNIQAFWCLSESHSSSVSLPAPCSMTLPPPPSFQGTPQMCAMFTVVTSLKPQRAETRFLKSARRLHTQQSPQADTLRKTKAKALSCGLCAPFLSQHREKPICRYQEWGLVVRPPRVSSFSHSEPRRRGNSNQDFGH